MSALKSIAARKMGFKVELMQWHNKMDLIALATAKGSIIVQRLNWQRICTFPPPVDSQKVACMSWRPDEKLLAVGELFVHFNRLNIFSLGSNPIQVTQMELSFCSILKHKKLCTNWISVMK